MKLLQTEWWMNSCLISDLTLDLNDTIQVSMVIQKNYNEVHIFHSTQVLDYVKGIVIL